MVLRQNRERLDRKCQKSGSGLVRLEDEILICERIEQSSQRQGSLVGWLAGWWSLQKVGLRFLGEMSFLALLISLWAGQIVVLCV